MKYKVISPPTAEPVSLADAKLHLRALPGESDEDSAIISPLITAAREYCENVTRRALAEQTIAAYPKTTRGTIFLPRPPVVELVSVTAYKADGTAVDLSDALLDEINGSVSLKNLPDGLRDNNPVEIQYKAGEAKVPMLLRQALLLLIGHWYENRETVMVGSLASVEVQRTLTAILSQYKDWWF